MADTQTPNQVPSDSPQVEVDAEPGIKLFVGNLAYSVTEDSLKTFFDCVKDTILSVQVITRGPHPAGYAFVTVDSQAAADKAIQVLAGTELEARNVQVEVAKPKEQKSAERRERIAKKRVSGRRGNKAPLGEVTDAEANGDAAQSARIDDAPPEDVNGESRPQRFRKKKTHRKKKSKAAISTDAAATEGVLGDATNTPGEAAEQTTEKKRPKRGPKRQREPRPPRVEGEAPEGEPSKTIVFVANLAFSVDEEALTNLFTENGISVNSARVIRRRFGTPRKSKGYAFIDVGGEAEQQKAIANLTGKMINDREVTVKVAVNAPHRRGASEGDDAYPGDGEAPTEV